MPCVLTINGGSSSIRFAVYEADKSLRQRLDGKIDCIGLRGTNLTVNDLTGKPLVPARLAATGQHAVAGFLLDGLEAQPVFASVNVVDLMKLQPPSEHPHGSSDKDFDEIFTKDKPVIFAYHAYPWLIHRLTYRRTYHDNFHVRGYQEEGTITTPFDKHGQNMPEIRNWQWPDHAQARKSAI